MTRARITPPSAAHPLDRAWAALDPAVQRQQATAEARAYYRLPCREWHNPPRDQQRNATRDELIEALDDTDEEATK